MIDEGEQVLYIESTKHETCQHSRIWYIHQMDSQVKRKFFFLNMLVYKEIQDI